jgi:hypothetical protein
MNVRKIVVVTGAAALLVWLGLAERRAEACGGCVSPPLPPSETSVVDSHRMVISLGLKRTVLWDQIEYSGSPEDFVWLLPVPSAEATVEVADGAFFDVIEGYTKPVVLPATAGCAASSGGCGGSGFAGGGLVGNPNDVTIYSQQTVGPYDVVTIG